MDNDLPTTPKARRASIDDLTAIGVELSGEHLRLAAGGGQHSLGAKFSYEGGGFDGMATYTWRF